MPRPFHRQIQTVLGAVAPEAISITLPHEHLLIDFKMMFAELAREMIADVTSGVGDTGIRAGLIGKISTTHPWTDNARSDNEKKVLRAAVVAQRETGAPLMIHPGRHPSMPIELAEFVRKEGGDLRRTIMCHICRTISDVRAVIDLAQTGIWLEYDLFGLENSFYPYNPGFDMPNDGGRMAHVLALIAAGHRDQILLSHDIAYKTSLVKYGGYGYHHLLVNVVPRLRAEGVDDAGLPRLLVDNPARAFALASAQASAGARVAGTAWAGSVGSSPSPAGRAAAAGARRS